MPTDDGATHTEGGALSRRSVLRGAGLAGITAALSACGGPAAAPPARDAVVITDQRGKQVRLAHAARRIVTIPMPAASILVAVDRGADHLTGMHDASWSAVRDGILGEFFPSLLQVEHDIASADFAPNVETVVGLRPDVVIQWGDDGAGIIAPLENAGLEVVGLTYGTQADLQAWITTFADLLGKPDRGHVLNSALISAVATTTAAGKAAPAPPPKVLYFNRFSEGLKVAGTGTFNDVYISMVGATNPASGPAGAPGKGMVGVDVEQVLHWDPDIVLLGNFDAAVPDDVYSDPVWRNVSAVRKRQVYKVPLGGYRWDPPSHESPLMWQWLSMVAFPEQPQDRPLRAEVERYYDLYYGRRPTPSQLDTILRTTLNGPSANYAQFDAA